jgi:UDPglucose--hexose-1-phosphate uridylyltransferase
LASLNNAPHRRFNPLTGEWVLVSPHRTQRPWQGQVERPPRPAAIQYDPACYLCPGNARAGGVHNPEYAGTFVFTNDFSALLPQAVGEPVDEAGLLVARPERGLCRVLCFSPRHDLTVARMSVPDLTAVVDAWAAEFASLGRQPFIGYVQIFENRGDMMGASNPHPHCQIWASETVPNEPAKEIAAQRAWSAAHGGACLLCRYLAREIEAGVRIVVENESFVAVVPYWAVWPFETLVLSRRHLSAVDELNPRERAGLAALMKSLTTRYDNLFETSFPYTMGFHQRPIGGEAHPECHFHAHYYPPLLRSATVKKFMVGFEMLGMPQRDITPEQAAERLRVVSDTHYLDRLE